MADKTSNYLLKIQLDIQNDKAMNDLLRSMEKVSKAQPKLQKGLKKTQIESRKFGRGVQNASYQVQDFIVQVSGGVDPLRSLSQQLPQLLINMGALGGIIGVVAAGLPILIQQFTDAGKSSETWAESLDTLDSAISRMSTFASGIDFSSWNKAWNEASESVRQAELSILEFRATAARAEAQDAFEAMTDEIAEAAGATFGGKFLEGFYKFLGGPGGDTIAEQRGIMNFAESMGIDRATADEIVFLFEQLDEGRVTLDEVQQSMVEIAKSTEGAKTEFYDMTESVIKQMRAETDLLRVREQIVKASESVATGTPLGESDDGDSRESSRYKQSAAMKSLAANMKWLNEQEKINQDLKKEGIALWTQFNPELAKYHRTVTDIGLALDKKIISEERSIELTKEAQTAYRQSTEGLTLMEQGLDIFNKSFDTMLNGVLMGTQSIADGFRDMAKVVIAQILKIVAQQMIANALTGAGYGDLAARIAPKAKGGVFDKGGMTAFAKGGVVNSPTVFPFANGVGLMGEAGPEAIMPLSRGKDGKLGVAGGGTNITINNMAPGVDVRTRETEQGLTIDVVMRQITAAISQGGNDISSAIEGAYSLGRGRAVY